MKKLFAVILSVVLSISFVPETVWAGENTGDIEQQNPYKSGYQEVIGTGIEISKEVAEKDDNSEYGSSRSSLPELEAKNSDLRYGRNYIGGIEGCDKYIWAYDMIAAGIGALETRINVYEEAQYEITIEEFSWIYDAVRNDYPEYFWWGHQYSYRYYKDDTVSQNEQIIVDFTPEYLWDKSDAEFYGAKAEFENAVAEIIDELEGKSDYEKELEIHDWLVRNNRYQDDAGNEHNAYGALIGGEIVCEGYARAFQLLLNRAGIECCIVTGRSGSYVGDENIANHAWNAAKINGSWYQVDVTWDDLDLSESGINETPEEMSYCYFNLTTEAMSENHAIISDVIPVPECSATEYFYYNYNSDMSVNIGEDDTNDIANYIAGQIRYNNFARVYVKDDNPDALIKWWFESEEEENPGRIAAKLHIVDSYSYSYRRLNSEGREYNLKLSLKDGSREYRAEASGWIIQPSVDSNITIRFYEAWVSDIETKITEAVKEGAADVYIPDIAASKWEPVEGTGLYRASFTFDNIPCGEYQVAVYKPGYPVVTGTFYLGTGGLTADESINESVNVWNIVSLGDVDKSGTVDFVDALYLKRYLADWAGYRNVDMKYADINCDGIVNIEDVSILERYIAGYSENEMINN